MSKKYFLGFCVITVCLFLPYQVETSAAVDSNESIKEYYNSEKETDKESESISESEKDKTEAPSEGVSVNAWDYIKMVFALLFVIVLLYGLLRFVNNRNKSFQHNQLIQNLGGAGVGQGKSIQLMQVGNSLFLVGIGENITLLKEITDPDEIEKLTNIYESKLESGKAVPYISELFDRFRENVTSKSNRNSKDNPSFNETFQKRLQEIQKDRSEVLNDWKTKERDKNE